MNSYVIKAAGVHFGTSKRKVATKDNRKQIRKVRYQYKSKREFSKLAESNAKAILRMNYICSKQQTNSCRLQGSKM